MKMLAGRMALFVLSAAMPMPEIGAAPPDAVPFETARNVALNRAATEYPGANALEAAHAAYNAGGYVLVVEGALQTGTPANATAGYNFCNIGELGDFHHIGNDVFVCHCKPVCRANCTRAVWSRRRNHHLDMHRHCHVCQFTRDILGQAGISIAYVN